MGRNNTPCGTTPHWVCYVALGKQLAAGPFHDEESAQENQEDIAGFEGVTTCYVWPGTRPPTGYITLVDVMEGGAA
jgi:hypothetical protein